MEDLWGEIEDFSNGGEGEAARVDWRQEALQVELADLKLSHSDFERL
jgi:hypothetical protein